MNKNKFRAWDRLNKEMCSVTMIDFDDMSIEGIRPDLGIAVLEKGEYNLIQSTGFLDSNGCEIYEGNTILAWIYSDEIPQELEVYYKGSGFVIDYIDSEADYFYLSEFPGSIEITGHIFKED